VRGLVRGGMQIRRFAERDVITGRERFGSHRCGPLGRRAVGVGLDVRDIVLAE